MVLRLSKRDFSATYKPTTQEEWTQDASFKDVDIHVIICSKIYNLSGIRYVNA